MTTRYRLTVSYLGGPFHGWQRQTSGRTIQGEIESALGTMTRGPRVPITGAGRTDAGVHAAAQVVHVDLPHIIPPPGLIKGLNGLLPEEIRIIDARTAPQTFHARFGARGKHYAYRARWSTSPFRPPWLEQRTARVQKPINMNDIERCAGHLPGKHDWASFTVANPETSSTVRHLYSARIRCNPWGFRLDLVGEGFLRYQVRRLVGALLQVGWQRRDPGWFLDLLHNPGPGSSVYTAPATGLTLEHVYYRRPDSSGDLSGAARLRHTENI